MPGFETGSTDLRRRGNREASWGNSMEQTVNNILGRAIRVAKLDLPVFREIARDGLATKQAAIVVAVVALASGIGAISDSFGRVVVSIIG
jgi:hypothetical protein